MKASFEVFEYDGPDWPARLERDWLRLYAAMPSRSVFHSLHAHRLYARHLMPPGRRLRYFGLRDGEQVRAICPLETVRDRGLGIPMWVLASPLHRHWPLSDVICPEDEARSALIPHLADYLAGRGERRLLLLGPAPTRSRLWNGLKDMPSERLWAFQTDVFDILDCVGSFDEFLGRQSRSFRRDLRRQEKKLEALPAVRHERAVTEPGLSDEFERFLALEASGWKVEAGNVIKFQPAVKAFYRGLLSLSDAGDHAMVLAVSTEGRTIASQLAIRTGEQLVAMKTAYDEEFAYAGPGVNVFRDAVAYACSDPGIRLLSFMGSTAWAQRWQPGMVPMGRAYIHLSGLNSRVQLAAAALRYGPARPLLRWLRKERDRMRSGSDGDDDE